jgi:hypothetical protein
MGEADQLALIAIEMLPMLQAEAKAGASQPG